MSRIEHVTDETQGNGDQVNHYSAVHAEAHEALRQNRVTRRKPSEDVKEIVFTPITDSSHKGGEHTQKGHEQVVERDREGHVTSLVTPDGQKYGFKWSGKYLSELSLPDGSRVTYGHDNKWHQSTKDGREWDVPPSLSSLPFKPIRDAVVWDKPVSTNQVNDCVTGQSTVSSEARELQRMLGSAIHFPVPDSKALSEVSKRLADDRQKLSPEEFTQVCRQLQAQSPIEKIDIKYNHDGSVKELRLYQSLGDGCVDMSMDEKGHWTNKGGSIGIIDQTTDIPGKLGPPLIVTGIQVAWNVPRSIAQMNDDAQRDYGATVPGQYER